MQDITRYRKKIAGARTSELQRLGSVLQDAGIKLDSVASSIATVSGRAMIEVLIDGERRPVVFADLALGQMRSKIPDLTLTFLTDLDYREINKCNSPRQSSVLICANPLHFVTEQLPCTVIRERE